MLRRLALASAALLAPATTPVAANSQVHGYEMVKASVAVGDLDLRTPAGLAEFNRRVETAARKACGTADYRDRAAVTAVSDCVESVRSSARPS